ITGKGTGGDADRLIVEDEQHGRASVVAREARQKVGDAVMVAVRAAAVTVDPHGSGPAGLNSAECEIVFVEFLGDLVKLHLLTGSERMLARVTAAQYALLRARRGERFRYAWREEAVWCHHD